VSSGRWHTTVDAQQHLRADRGVNVSVSSIRNVLRRAGLHGRVRHKKPLLRKKHGQARYYFALRYRKWKLDQWKRVVWSDESKFNVFGSDGRQYCWRSSGQPLQSHHVQPIIKHSCNSLGYLFEVEKMILLVKENNRFYNKEG
jgi:Transposase